MYLSQTLTCSIQVFKLMFFSDSIQYLICVHISFFSIINLCFVFTYHLAERCPLPEMFSNCKTLLMGDSCVRNKLMQTSLFFSIYFFCCRLLSLFNCFQFLQACVFSLFLDEIIVCHSLSFYFIFL